MTRAIVLALGLAASVLSAPAHATLIGDQITVRMSIPNLSFLRTGSTVVAADSSDAFSLTNSFLSFVIDPFASGVVFTLQSVSGAGGFAFGVNSFISITDLDWTDAPGEVSAVSFDHTLTALVASTSFTTDSATLTRTGQSSWSVGQSITINITAIHTEVPEPSTLAIFALGLAGLGFFMTRRRRVV